MAQANTNAQERFGTEVIDKRHRIRKIKKTDIGEIPEEWNVVTFGDVALRITYGFTNPMSRSKEGPWLITAKDVKDGKINYQTAEKTAQKDYDELLTDKSRPKVGTVLITKDGTLGEVAIVDRNNICVNQSVASIEPKGTILPEFLALTLQSPYMKKVIDTFSPATTIRHISITDLAKWKFGLPPINEQHKIASILSKVDDLIQKTDEIIEQTQRLKKGLMQLLLTRGINHTRFKEVHYYNKRLKIPEEWDIIKLKDHTSKIGSGVTPLGGSQVYEKEGIPFIRSQNVHFDRLHLDDIVYITKKIHDEMNNTKLQSYDVLLNITGASIGRCNYVPPDFGEGNVNQHVCIIRTTKKLNPIFLAKFLSTPLMQNLINSQQAGLSRQGLTLREIGNLYFLCPPLGEQQEIISILSNINTKLEKEWHYGNLANELKQGLMQKLLTGKIRVKV
jgi:type I restriction enzyme, S subunit